MSNRRIFALTVLAATPLFIAGPYGTQARGQCITGIGPDIINAEMSPVANYAVVDGIDAFSLGDTSCNVGNVNVMWQHSNPNHPVGAQNMYRHRVVNGAGRFEQVGQGWLKHAFTTVVNNLCCTCNSQQGSVLGVGCADSYTAGRNGLQCATTGGIGPRFQVNAHTGAFTWPYAFRNDCVSVPHTSVTRRLQVAVNDLNPALNQGATYYFEFHYVTADDAVARNQDNNASYRRAIIAGTNPEFSAAMTGLTQRTQPAIRAWQTLDPLVQLTDLDTPEALVGDPTARAILGCRVTELGNGQYRYEYALYNMNSDRSFDAFAVPSAPGLIVTNLGFHDVDYHSGDGYNSAPGAVTNFDGTDWSALARGSSIAWHVVPAIPVENSNALRWGTLYNFRFDCNAAPVAGLATLGLFKPVAGLPDTMTAATQVPSLPPFCAADLAPPAPPASPSEPPGDGTVNVQDLLAVIGAWGPCVNPPPNPCPADLAPAGGDEVINVQDLLAVIAAWGKCP